MFGLFRARKSNNTTVVDKIWLSNTAKFEACVQMARANEQCVFVAWFVETQEVLKNLFQLHDVGAEVILATQLAEVKPESILIFIEHHHYQIPNRLYLKNWD